MEPSPAAGGLEASGERGESLFDSQVGTSDGWLDRRVPFSVGEEILSQMGGKGEWDGRPDTLLGSPQDVLRMISELSLSADLAEKLPLAFDLIELDAERRFRTVALVDPDTKKLKRAYFHVPSYRRMTGNILARSLDLMRRGFFLPKGVPIKEEIHYYPDRLLVYDEIRAYPVLLMQHIRVESDSVLARYLINGGFVIDQFEGTLVSLHRQLQAQIGDRAKRVTLELGHPVFHAFFDIDRYYPGGPCPGVGPTPALEVDERIVAIVGPPFSLDRPCPANKFYANIIAFALTQPSKMGGRYLMQGKN